MSTDLMRQANLFMMLDVKPDFLLVGADYESLCKEITFQFPKWPVTIRRVSTYQGEPLLVPKAEDAPKLNMLIQAIKDYSVTTVWVPAGSPPPDSNGLRWWK